ncbi:MAG TPA: hypothetical protein P5232_04555 [Candidatus Moranbacteria bacterium]|nr:hypothetical protein [Candidatus Moranbacteria bacterium]
MNIEKKSPILSDDHKEMVDSSFNMGYKLDIDILNLWPTIISPKPLEHYEEYLRRNEKGFPGMYDYIMLKSDPKAIVEFNNLVDKYNADLERIKKEADLEAISSYFERARKIIKGESA